MNPAGVALSNERDVVGVNPLNSANLMVWRFQ